MFNEIVIEVLKSILVLFFVPICCIAFCLCRGVWDDIRKLWKVVRRWAGR